MSARERLAETILHHPWLPDHDGLYTGICPECPELPITGGHNSPSHANHLADAILAAGYRKPRTITTAEELDTMPIGTVVHWKGTTATRSFESEPAGLNWVAIGSAMGYSVHEFNLPVTVLHEPTP